MKPSTNFHSPWLFYTWLLVVIAPALEVGADAPSLKEALQKAPVKNEEISAQHVEFVRQRIPKLEPALSKEAWTAESKRLRKRVLNEVVFRGVPDAWRKHKVRTERIDTIQQESYSITKLRFEAIPGLWIPALLYEPKSLNGKVPVILNVNGHDRKGKASPYKQIRCINQAKRGMIALNLEWLGMGQLRKSGFTHNHLAKLDVCGVSGLSVFFLAMSRGIDVLLEHPNSDPKRLAVTGLSGGGWQTIILSSLDERVKLSVPVAGYSALEQRLVHRSSIGDLEQNPNDLIRLADYAHLTAMMVPRPTLLIYNAKDNCCFASATVKPNTFDPVVPFYEQAGVGNRFEYYENHDPGDHNYELDNRQQLYRFLGKHFLDGKNISKELPSADEVLSAEDLLIPLPEGNQNFDTLAARVSRDLPKKWAESDDNSRKRLRSILRYEPLRINAMLSVYSGTVKATKTRVTRRAYKTGTWTIPAFLIAGEKPKGTVILVSDKGASNESVWIANQVEKGNRVLALDPILIGSALPKGGLYPNAQLMATVGSRPLGVQCAQLATVIKHAMNEFGSTGVGCHMKGARASVIGLCTAAIHDQQMEWTYEGKPKSLKDLLGPKAAYGTTPELYCFGLLKWFDIALLESMTR